MNNNGTKDIGFIQDISQLDRLRKQAVSGDKQSENEALKAAAKQFESVFTSMLLKSMRDANSEFKTDLFNSQTENFYRQMLDDQMSSELSTSGKLGLADMIVAQLSANSGQDEQGKTKDAATPDQLQAALEKVRKYHQDAALAKNSPQMTDIPASSQIDEPRVFKSPESFIETMKPYAEKAARALGIDSSLLLAQAALETGWGQKVVSNAAGSSHNLFNIKADRRWQGDKVTSQTLEYRDQIPVMEKAAFRSYSNYQDSFDDYVRFLAENPRYSTALNQHGNDQQFIREIHQAGYATDPDYANKVLRVQAKIKQMD
ncbi:Peptidoglycan hydrolase FlgJ [Vibrio aerogenes CECT 7868]|uniref:Peptidoglycan hydrolase FlgJ n=1 Tax=Vibrio aerogenes CECT 7868 TaxID=1216006 RepID=A0A1M5WBB0_9VIBR|nr:flagellar assembly peptidoglycan hydrolase FlgJ [Vibrio aerogenes]SHH84776.1 Peptidoglycan hydrolase FlgJ [Vibrio aerogenes CECT 7868]